MEETRAHSEGTGCTPVEGMSSLLIMGRNRPRPGDRLLLATRVEGSIVGAVERKHVALMRVLESTGKCVWDLDAKKWDLWKAMRS